jgi:hypothetical protein
MGFLSVGLPKFSVDWEINAAATMTNRYFIGDMATRTGDRPIGSNNKK